MRVLKVVSILFIMLALVAGSVFARGHGDVTRINVSHPQTDQHPWHHGAIAFANYINANSDGRFDVSVFPNSGLSQGNAALMVEQVQAGTLHIAIESLTVLAAFNDRPSILQLPFTFSDRDHVSRFVQLRDPVWEGFMGEFERSNFIILGSSPRPMRQLNNNVRMIRTPADMEGLRMRVPMNPFFVSIFETLGASPVAAPPHEIYMGIQLGTFAGEDNSIPNQYDFRIFEVAQNFSVVNYIADLSFIFINSDFYRNLNDADRRLFHAAGQEFVRVEQHEIEAHYALAMAEGHRLGVDFWVMPPENKQLFVDRLAPFFEQFSRSYTPAEWTAFHEAVRRSAP